MGSWKNKWTELIHWKGMPESEASWKKVVTLWEFENQIQEYLQPKLMTTWRDSIGKGFLSPLT